jgi:hypothetical protein
MDIKASCISCKGNFIFDSKDIGQTAPCPHCGIPVSLTAPTVARMVALDMPDGSRPLPLWPWIVVYGACLLIAVILCLCSAQHEFTLPLIFMFPAIQVVAVYFYFMPAIVAYRNGKKNFKAILILNLLLGWTVIGWVGGLVWACVKD